MASLALSIGLIASLKRAEEVATLSLPGELTTTVFPVIAVPAIPAMKVDFWVPCLPMRMVFASPALPGAPISMLLLPMVRLLPAVAPRAMLLLPVVLFDRALMPQAVLVLLIVLLASAPSSSGIIAVADGIVLKRGKTGSVVSDSCGV